MDTKQFVQCGRETLEYCAKFMDTIDKRRVVSKVEPGYLIPLLPKEAPMNPEPFSDILKDIEEKIMPGITHWKHPNFHAYFPGSGSNPGILADIVSGTISCNGFSWLSSPAYTELEIIIMDWMAKLLDLPKFYLSSEPGSFGGGCIESSGSASTLNAFLAARFQAICYLKGNMKSIYNESDNSYLPKLVAYTSIEAHSSVEKAAMIAMVKLRKLQADENFSLRGDTLKAAIAADLKEGLLPFFVCATIGTTGTGAFDNLEEIGRIVKTLPCCWFHVDGAYGGSTRICPELRSMSNGLEYSDSFMVNPYKWMLMNFDCTCFFVKQKAMLINSMLVNPLYIHFEEKTATEFRNWGVQLSRRFRSLKIWFALRTYGISKLQEYVRSHVAMAKHFESLVKSDDRFKMMNKVETGLACFRMKGSDRLNQNLLALINEHGIVHMIPTTINNKYSIRYCITDDKPTVARNEYAWREILAQAEVASKMGPNSLGHRVLERHANIRFITSRVATQINSMKPLYNGATPILVVDDYEDDHDEDELSDDMSHLSFN